MLAIVLGILKVVGIVLLWILGILLVLILLLLLWPISYRASAKKDQESIHLRWSVWWLAHFLHVGGIFEKTEESRQELHIYILGIPVLDLWKRLQQNKLSREKRENAPERPKRAAKQPTVAPSPWTQHPTKETEARAANLKVEVVHRKKPGFFVQLGARISAAIGKIKQAMTSLSALAEKIGVWLEYLGSEAFAHVKQLVFSKIRKVLRHILPRKIEGTILFGLEDPALTGELLGLLAVIYPKLPGRFAITPDFEKARLEGDGVLRGHIVLGYLLLQALLLIVNRDVRELVKRVKNQSEPTVNES